jgi:outer membrane receptor protein involved in Fe transport
MIKLYSCLFLLIVIKFTYSQQLISGSIRDFRTSEVLTGAYIILHGTTIATTADINGNFKLSIKEEYKVPYVLDISMIGYEKQTIVVNDPAKWVYIKLNSSSVGLSGVDIATDRIKQKQKLNPLTVEQMDLIAIRETPAANFYDGLGQLKGVDITAASIGFKVINTRGFNSTSPVRSLQIIDGVDNQAPGLNFSLGNFLGSSELDVKSVDIISGASTAFYGPNAFNGVIAMNTKSPFTYPGLSVMLKGGERNMVETAIRYADKFKYLDGHDKFAYKFNLYYMRAHDWEATNYGPIENSKNDETNPGGYNAVNRYGDEYYSYQDFSDSSNYYRTTPGLGTFYRPGYQEKDIVDYNSENMKANLALHYKLKDSTEFILASNFGTGTTVYQGENRLSLKNILFFQNRIEARKENKWFIQAYATNENSGDSYDAVLTAILMQQSSKPNGDWANAYYNYWYTFVVPQVQDLPGFPKYVWPNPYDYKAADSVLKANNDKLKQWHSEAGVAANSANILYGFNEYAKPGTKQFDSLFNLITSRNISLNKENYGSRFFDRSALYHIKGEYIFKTNFADFTTGGNFRMYSPNSMGTIFIDTGSSKIVNREFGIYLGLEKKILAEKMKINLTARLDKNQNFKYNFSPAASIVYVLNPDRVFRFSFSSAIRNPTLLDQYLNYNVGPAILKGNIDGFNHLLTVNSFIDILNTKDTTRGKYFDVAPIQPEKVKTFELGFRCKFFKKIYIDAGYYYSFYKDFIGYKIGVDAGFSNINTLYYYQVYRVAANAKDRVTTQGFSMKVNYYFKKYFMLSGNYSWNRLNQFVKTDSIIPAYNTPEHKFNISLGGSDFEGKLFNLLDLKGWAFNFNYKWVQGFVFEGSPQFTGIVPAYDALDGQLNYTYSKWKTTFKLGASNILNRKFFQVYGGPYTGRLAYLSVLVDLPGHK